MVATVFATFGRGAFTSMAPVGQTDRHWPHVVQIDSTSGRSMKVPILPSVPVPSTSMAPMNWWPSWQACTQRWQRMQLSMAMLNTGLLVSVSGRSRPSQRGSVMPCWSAAMDSSRKSLPPPFLGNMASVNSRTPLRMAWTSGVSVHTFMPSAAGTEHDAG